MRRVLLEERKKFYLLFIVDYQCMFSGILKFLRLSNSNIPWYRSDTEMAQYDEFLLWERLPPKQLASFL